MGTQRHNHTQAVQHQRLSVKIWFVVTEKEVIGPHFFENKTENQDTYKNVLRYFAYTRLRGYPENTIFQQDDSPPYCSNTLGHTLIESTQVN